MKFKRLLAVILSSMILFGTLPFSSFTANAATNGAYTYTVSGGKAIITDCSTTLKGNVTIPSTLGGYPVSSIGYEAFYNCYNLKSIIIPDSVVSIGEHAFQSCSNLTNIIIPDSVTSIGDYAFYYCRSLTSITIPDSVVSIGEHAFEYCYSITNINVDTSNTSYTSIDGVLLNKVESKIIYYPTGKTTSSYTILDSVKNISDYAFSNCSNLTNIIIPDSVTSIGDYAFSNCPNLTNIIIPDSVTTMGDYVFSNCSNLKSITIGKNVTKISDSAFKHCSNLTSIAIPDGVITIGSFAFHDCSKLTSIIIPDSVVSIGYYAFYYCSNLTSITIGNNVTKISSSAFYGCSNITNITIPDSTTSIGSDAFSDCSSLTNINVDTNNTAYTSIDGVLLNKNKSQIICYPAGKTATSYTIPDSVTSINNYAFYNCSHLTSITIPKSVTSIGYSAFEICSNLKNIYYCGNTVVWNKISIGSNNSYLTSATRNHPFKEWIVIKEPTCTEDGEKYHICSACNEEKAEIINAYGHDYAEEFTIDKQATDFENGTKSKHCSRCDSVTETTVIPKTSIEYGECGINAKWAVRENGTLVISGSGAIENYGYYSSVPWYKHSANIISVEIGEEITAVGHYSFNSLENLKTVKCGNADIDFNKLYVFSVSDIDFYSFSGGKVEQYVKDNGYNIIKPENPEKPLVPTLLYKNATSITLVPLDGYEYSLDGVNFQKSNAFDGLLPDTEYLFYQRIAEGVYGASAISGALRITTAAIPSKPQIENITGNIVTMVAVDSYEYSLDLVNWQTSNIFIDLEYDKKYKVYTRTIPTDVMPYPTPSEPQEFVIASAPEVKLIGATKIVMKHIDGYEYSIDGVVWQSSNIFDKLIPDFEYTIFQRFANCDFYSTGTQIMTNGQDVNVNPSSTDLVLLRKELLLNDEHYNLCYDYNGDGEINVLDLVRLKKFLVGIDVPIGASEETQTQTVELLSEPAYLKPKSIVI